MKRSINATYPLSAVPPPGTNLNRPPQRVPQLFIDAMKRLASDVPSPPPPVEKAPSTTPRWKSSFCPLDEKEGGLNDGHVDDSESPEQSYEPYCPVTSDPEVDTQQTAAPHCSMSSQDNNVECQSLSPGSKQRARTRWDVPFRESPGKQTDKEMQDLDLRRHRGFDCRSEEVCSPDRPHLDSSPKYFPPFYEELRSSREEQSTPSEYHRETSSSGRRSSPPRLQQDYQCTTGGGGKQQPVASNQHRNKVVMDTAAITCELCDAVLANGEELDEHLDSKGHWDTLEHIQLNNKYDDATIAFLQDVLLYKSRQCSGMLEEHALQDVQEKHHMTKVQMLHCSACKAFVLMSAAEVKGHITSQEHLSNVKDFEVQQRHLSLSRAESVLTALQPHLEIFLKGGTPFW